MSLDETDSSDDSTYSSQYQSDANSTPRTGTSHTLPRHLPTTRSSVTSNSGKTFQMKYFEYRVSKMKPMFLFFEKLKCIIGQINI